jgi:hypothetical protein
LITFFAFFFAITAKPIDDHPVILDGSSDIYASEFLFVTTTQGIYVFDRNTVTWGRVTTANGLPSNMILTIGLDEGILWVATTEGLVSADIRINDWRQYEDIPDIIEGLAFDDDYIYIGGEFGTYRFDKYIETWEMIDTLPVRHMIKTKQYLWCIRDQGISRYDPLYEKFEELTNVPGETFSYGIETSSVLWFFSTTRFVSFHKESERWSTYPGLDVQDYEIIGDSVLVLSNDSLFLYDPRADVWTVYRDIIGFPPVKGIGVYGNKVLCGTESGLFLYNWSDRSRETFTTTSGLKDDVLIDAFEDAQYLYVISSQHIEYLSKNTGTWEIETIRTAGRYRPRIFYLDEAGGHARIIPGIDLKLQGRAYYTTTHSIADSITTSDYDNINLKLIGQHMSNRLVSMYYDDTDKDQPMYGFGYRGLDRDLLYRCDGGYLRSEYYEMDLLPEFSTLGGHAKLRYKNHALNIQGGYLKSRIRKDFYFGTASEKEGVLDDILFQRNVFYSIYVPERPVSHGTDTVFIDDRQVATNTVDTRINTTLGDIPGDYDVFINGLDYTIDHEKGFIQFFRSQSYGYTIILALNGQEIVIQSDSVQNHDKENIYFLGPDILPGSCSLSIVDTLGQEYPLSIWDLDTDGDGLVDPAYLNHDLGYLTFPQERPFPNTVYDDTLHIYSIHYTLLSTTPFYYLSYRPVFFGSEKVYVDGELVSRGLHYVVDYTSGILLFLQEDLITDFSEIEVEYSSVERNRKDIYYSVQPIIRFGDHVDIAPGFTQIIDEQLVHLSGRLEYGSVDNVKVKYTPQGAVSSDSAWAHRHDIITRFRFVSLTGHYSSFSNDFEGFNSREKKYGMIENRGTVAAHIDVHQHVTLDGSYSREQQRDSLVNSIVLQHFGAKANYLNPVLPMVSLSCGKDLLPDYIKNRIRAHVHYDLSLLRSQFKLSTTVTNTQIDFSDEEHDHNVFEYIIHSGVILPVPISANVYFRKNQLYFHDTRQRQTNEIIGSLAVDAVPGLYYTGNYLLEVDQHYLNTSQEVALQYYFYNNLHIAPGRWHMPLSIINLACGMGKNFEEYIRSLNTEYDIPPYLYSYLNDGTLSSLTLTDSYYGLIQVTPRADLLLWNKYSVMKNGQAIYEMGDLWNTVRNILRIEYEPFSLGLFTLLWDYKKISSYPTVSMNNYYGEWNKPWTSVLRTKFSTNYRVNQDDYSSASLSASELRSNIETLLRFTTKSYLAINIGGRRQENDFEQVTYHFTPGAGINLNLLHFLYVQCDYTLTHILDSTTTHQVTAKLTGQF